MAFQPTSPDEQLLRYAAELRGVHAAERAMREQLDESVRLLQEASAQQVLLAQDLRRAVAEERALRAELAAARHATAQTLAAALAARDPQNARHGERTQHYATVLAGYLHLMAEEIQALALGALLHDIGRLGVPDAVLWKPGPLTAAEWIQMRQHTLIGADLLRQAPLPQTVVDVALCHHERWDGTGYPERLAGEHIPLAARVVAVADAYDALTSDSGFHQGVGIGAAVSEIERCAGRAFDPQVVAILMQAFYERRIP